MNLKKPYPLRIRLLLFYLFFSSQYSHSMPITSDVKPVPSAIKMLPDAKMEPPYDGAKEMLLVENVDDSDLLTELFKAMYDELPMPRKKK